MNSEWTETTLADFAEISPRRTISKGNVTPFIDMAAVSTHARDIEGNIATRMYKGSGSKFRNGDTLLARITPCLENGKTALVSNLPDGIQGHGSTEFIVLGPKTSHDALFLYYLVRSDEFRSYAIARMEGTSGRQRVPNLAVAQYPLRCPSQGERLEIGNFLGTLDDRITLLRETNATLEAIAQAIFKSWFVDFGPVRANMKGRAPDGMDKETAALFPDAFEELGPGLVPKGWHLLELDKMATYLNGLALQKFPPTGSDDLPVIKIAQLRKGNTVGADMASGNIKPEYVIRNGDVLFSWSGSLEVEIWCGGDGALNQHLFKVTSEQYPKWFYYLWTRHHLEHFRQIAASKATTMGHIQRIHLSNAKAMVPSMPVLNSANDVLQPIIQRIIENTQQAHTLASLRDALLPRLISGQLRLPDAESPIEETCL